MSKKRRFFLKNRLPNMLNKIKKHKQTWENGGRDGSGAGELKVQLGLLCFPLS